MMTAQKTKWDTQNAFESVRREATEQKSNSVVENLILKLGLSDQQVAEVAEVSIDFVKKVRNALENKKK